MEKDGFIIDNFTMFSDELIEKENNNEEQEEGENNG